MPARRLSVLTVTAVMAVTLISAGPAAAQPVAVNDVLAQLPVVAENTSGYNRDFFQQWIDVDRDGCDTRAEVLMIESLVATGGGCPVDTGHWVSYYDGATWTLASDVDIDHMVPLSEAWDSGAYAWTAEQRRDFANDLDYEPSLVAVTDNVNQSKGDRDPAQWMPPSPGAYCRYVTEWVGVKYRWNLTVDTAERNAIQGVLSSSCPGASMELPTKAGTPGVTPPAGTAAIQAYVTAVYRDLFNREPDPMGLATWTTALASGTPYGEVANAITSSREFRSGLITNAYTRYLGRAPDPAGLEFWLAQMQYGMHIEQMQAGFIGSDEFYQLAGSDGRRWVTGLYRAVLEREPGSSEVDFWVGRLSAGADRSQVALGFVYSTEYLTTVVDGYYQQLLDRSIDPSGAQTWVTLIQQGARDEQIIASIVSSEEYRAKV